MTVVLVHGVPETPAVWDPLLAALDRDDILAPQLPGFGCPLPAGFDPTMDGYAGWLDDQLRDVDGPIDLVGHDWGALLALRVLSRRPAAFRSWVVDFGNLDESFEWHDTARVWQTPGEGEAMIDGFVGLSAEDRGAVLEASGVPPSHAVDLAAHLDETMGAAILRLYRSAVDVGTEWGPGIDDITGHGLCIEAELDPFRSPGSVARLAERTGAAVAPLPRHGHWWMLSAPAEAARLLEAHWAAG